MNSTPIEIYNNENYLNMLSLMGRLSNLFAETDIPFIHYRVTENLFCKYYNAENLSRTDTAYDAKINSLGIGIKTFTFDTGVSTEKIAEFNSLSSYLKQFSGYELAIQLGLCRNKRMQVANDIFNIKKATYHIIGRKKRALEIFNTPYEFVNIENIKIIKDGIASLQFTDGINQYNFNRSKSVLMKKFIKPDIVTEVPIEILEDPYALLESLFTKDLKQLATKSENRESVILPLYSTQKQYNNEVPHKSGLNQWNADGRIRHEDEVYIPVPREIHKNYYGFFPNNLEDIFKLRLPDGTILTAKMCQSGLKGLMSNPNKALGNWILRKVLKLPAKTIVTREILDKAGFDSLIVYKNHYLDYSIDVCYSMNYLDFIEKFK